MTLCAECLANLLGPRQVKFIWRWGEREEKKISNEGKKKWLFFAFRELLCSLFFQPTKIHLKEIDCHWNWMAFGVFYPVYLHFVLDFTFFSREQSYASPAVGTVMMVMMSVVSNDSPFKGHRTRWLTSIVCVCVLRWMTHVCEREERKRFV